MAQLSEQKYYTMYGVHNLETEKQMLWKSFREFIDTTLGGVSIPLVLADRQKAVTGVRKLRDDLKSIGV